MNPLEIRRVRPEEYEIVGKMVRAAYESEYKLDADYLAEMEDTASRDAVSMVLVAEEAGSILGSVTIPNVGEHLISDSEPGEMDLRLLGVAGSARGKGVGIALMNHCVSVARDRGAHRLVLHTGHVMVKAHSLYERLGFKRIPEREFGIETEHGPVQIFVYGLEIGSETRETR